MMRFVASLEPQIRSMVVPALGYVTVPGGSTRVSYAKSKSDIDLVIDLLSRAIESRQNNLPREESPMDAGIALPEHHFVAIRMLDDRALQIPPAWTPPFKLCDTDLALWFDDLGSA